MKKNLEYQASPSALCNTLHSSRFLVCFVSVLLLGLVAIFSFLPTFYSYSGGIRRFYTETSLHDLSHHNHTHQYSSAPESYLPYRDRSKKFCFDIGLNLTTVDIILPITFYHIEYLALSFASFCRFFQSFERVGQYLIIVPENELHLFESFIRNYTVEYPRCSVLTRVVRVKSDVELVPELKTVDRSQYYVFPQSHLAVKGHGWLIQMVLKFAAAEHVKSDFYLIIDSDVLLMRATRMEDLFVGHRAMAQLEWFQQYKQWWEDADFLLKAGRCTFHLNETVIASVTPEFFNRDIVFGLLNRIESLYNTPVYGFLLTNGPWTEYTLYYTYAYFSKTYELTYTGAPAGLFSWVTTLESGKERITNVTQLGQSHRTPFMVLQDDDILGGHKAATELVSEKFKELINLYHTYPNRTQP